MGSQNIFYRFVIIAILLPYTDISSERQWPYCWCCVRGKNMHFAPRSAPFHKVVLQGSGVFFWSFSQAVRVSNLQCTNMGGFHRTQIVYKHSQVFVLYQLEAPPSNKVSAAEGTKTIFELFRFCFSYTLPHLVFFWSNRN